MKREDIEITAPAGSWDSLVAAVQGNADSVYFGVENLNMRAASSVNFTLKDIPRITEFCRKNNLKSYLTLNVVVYDKETAAVKKIVDSAIKNGISAIIASDISVITYAASKGMDVHLSTQCNITNIEAIEFYSRFAGTAVLARELNLDQIGYISSEIKRRNICGPDGKPFRLEIFAHGALCMAVSGKCYLSLHEYNKSANRGECYQVCRRSYIVTDRETGYELCVDNQFIMSPKDLCTISFLDKITDSGINILKIEGRARSPEYVRTVTSCYDEALKAVESGNYTVQKIDELTDRLSRVFNRGFWDGYYLGRKTGEWTNRYGSSATMKKTYLGIITNYYTRPGVAEIKLENGDLSEGDNILITGPTTGALEIKVSGLRDAGKNESPIVSRGNLCSLKTPARVRKSDKVFRWEHLSR